MAFTKSIGSIMSPTKPSSPTPSSPTKPSSPTPGPLISSSDDEYPIILCPECSKEHPRYNSCPNMPLPPNPCRDCNTEHSYFICCPNMPCKVCYKEDHYLRYCPFLDNYPRGQDFDSVKYEIVCHCGFPFDTDKWLCIYCPHSPFPKLQLKACEICHTSGDHVSVDCPNDTKQAAVLRSKLKDLVDGQDFAPYEETVAKRAAAAAAAGFSGDPPAVKRDTSEPYAMMLAARKYPSSEETKAKIAKMIAAASGFSRDS